MSLVRKTLIVGGALIAGYLLLVHSKGTVAGFNSVGTNSVNVVKAFQGRK